MKKALKPFNGLLFFVTLIVAFVSVSCVTVPCNYVETAHGGNCICTANSCDFLDNPEPSNQNEIIIVSSSKGGLRFNVNTTTFSQNIDTISHINIIDKKFTSNYNEEPDSTRLVTLEINRDQIYQKIVGFGGSYTGAVTHLVNELPKRLQDNVYKSFYGDEGIGFNLMRISIGGSDFDLAPWAYNEFPENDLSLTNFTLDSRDEMRISQIKRLMMVAQRPNLRIKAAAWSAPRWMKTNNEWTGFGRLKRVHYGTWSKYHLKWLELMENNGLPIWAISLGNEPLNGLFFMFFIKFMSMGWSPSNQAVWLADYLGPQIRESKFQNITIFSNDDQRYTLPWWFRTMNETRNNSLSFIDAVGVHWYWDEAVEPHFIEKARQYMPNKIFLNTESCIGDKPWEIAGPLLGSWERGEKYVRTFIQDLKHGFNGWIDWNIVLDETGGPNYVNNLVDAPAIVNTKTFREVYKQPMFYTIGHFSKFITENSERIEVTRSNVNVDSVAFLKPDGGVVVIVHNSGKADVDILIKDSVRGFSSINVPPKSVHSFVYK